MLEHDSKVNYLLICHLFVSTSDSWSCIPQSGLYFSHLRTRLWTCVVQVVFWAAPMTGYEHHLWLDGIFGSPRTFSGVSHDVHPVV
jgi:hypothetical protein